MTAFINTLRPSQRSKALAFDVGAILTGSLLIALLAQISVLGVGPVPFTLQTLAVLLIGSVLGSKRGALAVVTYMTEVAFGFPFLATGAAGLVKIVGPTGGYLVGFVACAYLVGYLLENGWKEKIHLTVLALFMGSSVVLLCGTAWLSLYVGSFSTAFTLGFIPFIVGDLIKLTLAAALIPTGEKILSHFKR